MRILLLCAMLLWTTSVWAVELFSTPPELTADVAFWKRVYTEVDTSSGLLHDERDLSVVYETLHFSSDNSADTRELEVEAREDYYQAILQRLAAGERENLTSDEARVLALWPQGVSSATLEQAVYDIRFQLGQSDRFLTGLQRSGAWEAYIRRAFAARGMPEELAVLPHVESSFDPQAYSWLGAAGMWQFIPSTGERYLRIDNVLDERLDPYASTDAAVQLLALNYAVTGSWPLAITAYNHGAAGMRRAVDSLGTHDIVTILRRYQSPTFGFASRNFYVSFLAALEVDRDAETYFPGLKRDHEQRLDTVEVPDFISLSTLCEALHIDAARLRAYNLMLMEPVWSGEKYVPAGYPLRLPPGTLDSATAAQDLASIPAAYRFAAQVPDEYYLVNAGDTLSDIAARYGVSTDELMSRNQLSSANLIWVGQSLSLPGSDAAPVLVASEVAPVAVPVGDEYRVQPGDTLSNIAARYGVSTDELALRNQLSSTNLIRVEQRLSLPTSGQFPVVASAPDAVPVSVSIKGDYRVQPDDTLTSIAARYDTTTEMLAQVNGLSDADDLQVGQALALAATRESATQKAPERVEAKRPSEAKLAELEEAEPVSPAAVEHAGKVSATAARPAATADPADYEVAADDTIEVQAIETLGHYADWLEIPTQRLRDINRLSFDQSVIVGWRLKLDFSEVDSGSFVARRVAYHRALQAQFFKQYRIQGVREQPVRIGDTLWSLALHEPDLPVWLLRQYNPDLDFANLQPGIDVIIPRLVSQKSLGSRG